PCLYFSVFVFFLLGAQIRLVGSGSSQCSGRVEIYLRGAWGTVCDDGWDLPDATVVCRQLNCGTAWRAMQSAHFGQGSGNIWLDDLTCSGHESSLTECGHGGVGVQNCNHGEDAGVICSGSLIRLAGSGSTLCSGRVEVYHSGAWGTVCDDSWDLNDAKVVCRQLECGEALGATGNAAFGEGTGEIFLDDLACSGNEGSLAKCQHNGFKKHNCQHNEDAGVICSSAQIRLVGSGSTQCSGRVEIYLRGAWGTVCDDGWDLPDATVVCRQLNCGTAWRAMQSAHFGQGSGNIWLDDLTCSGHESSLTECGHGGVGVQNCNHGEDAGVICSGETHLLYQM
uniref:SRCR domain-containing protein n=1 Tax=Echeneis naucrates TaxID=173247 RepID=A0A665TF14_ECHNA